VNAADHWDVVPDVLKRHALAFIEIPLEVGHPRTGAFAPNHKGMPLVEKESQLDFLRRQVLTSRDVKAHPLTDFLYGGLNYQIEHHLFPSMPRSKLREAQTIVRAFCGARSIPYRESGALQSHREILQYLHQVSAPLREARA